MASLIDLKTFTDERGNLTVIEKVIPFTVKRLFYIYGVDNSIRGGHRHHTTIQAAICLQGSCAIYCDNGKNQFQYQLIQPHQCLILDPEDYHTMSNFSNDAILMVLASTEFDAKDYIYEPYH